LLSIKHDAAIFYKGTAVAFALGMEFCEISGIYPCDYSLLGYYFVGNGRVFSIFGLIVSRWQMI